MQDCARARDTGQIEEGEGRGASIASVLVDVRCQFVLQREAKEKKEAQDAEEKAKKEAEEKAKKESEEKIANEVRHKDVGRVVAGSHSGRHAEGRENH